MLFTTLFLASTLASVGLSKPSSGNHHLHPRSAPVQKRDGQIITTGAVGLGDGQTYPRLDINEIYLHRPDYWSLYVRTMAKWKEAPKTDWAGYWGIAKIHGVPRVSWDGVEPCEGCDSADGYCTHDSVLFPCWHRLYMALFEQELIKVATDVANTFDGAFGDRMKSVAQVLRAAFWDWAATPDQGSDVFGPALSSPQVTIVGPNGEETVDNPFYSYHFTDPSDLPYTPFNTWTETYRYPDTNDVTAHSQEQKAIDAFKNVQQNLGDQVYQILTQCKSYFGFATDDAGAESCANSIEAIHNTVHTTTGGAGENGVSGGHMTFLPLAAFDPPFFLHHCMVDRIFALWQVANPDSYGASQAATHNTWTIQQGSTQDANSPLKPFRKGNDSWWTCNDIRDFTGTFHYTYPEFLVGDGQRSTILNYVDALYGTNPTFTAGYLSGQAIGNETTGATGGNGGRALAQGYGTGSSASSSSSAPVVGPTDTGSSASSSSSAPVVGPTDIGSSASSSSSAPVGGPTDTGSGSGSSTGSGSGSGIGIGIGPLGISIGLPWPKPTGTAPGPYPHISGVWNASHSTSPSGPLNIGVPEINKGFLAPNGSQYQYQCNIKTPRYAFDGSYTIFVFDGQPSSNNSAGWLAEPNCIGKIGILAGGRMTGHDSISAGSVPVTRYLQKLYLAGKLPALSEDVVVPYMEKNLNWIIVFDGQQIHPKTLQGYQASFLSGLLSPKLDGELPTWSNLLPQVSVTKDKAGGITQVVDGLLGGVGNAFGDVGNLVGGITGAIGGLLGGLTGDSPSGHGAAGGLLGGLTGGSPSGNGAAGGLLGGLTGGSPSGHGAAGGLLGGLTGDSPSGHDAAGGHQGSGFSHPVQVAPLPATTPGPAPQGCNSPPEDVTTTAYTTQYVTYCPCTETTAASSQPSATGYAQSY